MKYLSIILGEENKEVEKYFKKYYPVFEKMELGEVRNDLIISSYHFILSLPSVNEAYASFLAYSIKKEMGIKNNITWRIYNIHPSEYHKNQLDSFIERNTIYSIGYLNFMRERYSKKKIELAELKSYLINIIKDSQDEQLRINAIYIF